MDIDRRLLYRWRDQLDPPDKSEWPPPHNSRESTLHKEVSQLKQVLAKKTLELAFFNWSGKSRRLLSFVAGTSAVKEEMEVRSTIQRSCWNLGALRLSPVTAELRRRGLLINDKRGARLMREDKMLAARTRLALRALL